MLRMLINRIKKANANADETATPKHIFQFGETNLDPQKMKEMPTRKINKERRNL